MERRPKGCWVGYREGHLYSSVSPMTEMMLMSQKTLYEFITRTSNCTYITRRQQNLKRTAYCSIHDLAVNVPTRSVYIVLYNCLAPRPHCRNIVTIQEITHRFTLQWKTTVSRTSWLKFIITVELSQIVILYLPGYITWTFDVPNHLFLVDGMDGVFKVV